MSIRGCPVCGASLIDELLDAANTLQRCPRCRHVVRDLARCPAGARAHAYGGAAGLDLVRLRLTMRRLRRLITPGARVFEIGYGAGTLLRWLHADGYQVAGIDSGQAGLDTTPGLPSGALRHRGAATVRLGRDEHPYDLVVAIHVIEHVPDPLAVLSAAHALLRPGGRIAVITPSADSLGLDWFGAAWWMLEDPTHLALFSPDSLTRALRASGFVGPRVTRPLLESMSCEAASLRRRGHTDESGGPGVMVARSTLALAAGTLPIDLFIRLARPRLRPALFATAVVPGSGVPAR